MKSGGNAVAGIVVGALLGTVLLLLLVIWCRKRKARLAAFPWREGGGGSRGIPGTATLKKAAAVSTVVYIDTGTRNMPAVNLVPNMIYAPHTEGGGSGNLLKPSVKLTPNAMYVLMTTA